MTDEKKHTSLNDDEKKVVAKALLNIANSTKGIKRLQSSMSPNNEAKATKQIKALSKSIRKSRKTIAAFGLEPDAMIEQAAAVLETKAKRVHWSSGDPGGPGVYGLGPTRKHWK